MPRPPEKSDSIFFNLDSQDLADYFVYKNFKIFVFLDKIIKVKNVQEFLKSVANLIYTPIYMFFGGFPN